MRSELGLSVSKWTINRFLNSHSYMKMSKNGAAFGPDYTSCSGKALRGQKVMYNGHWTGGMSFFLMKRSLSWMDRDNSHCYWHDIRKKEKFHTQAVTDRRSVMIWAAFSWPQRSELVVIDGRMDANCYMGILNSCLSPMNDVDMIYLKDNAPSHVA